MEMREHLKAAKARLAALGHSSPVLFAGFSKVAAAASAAGSFSAAERELVAVAIAVAKGCDDCILYHLDAALHHGADERQLVEALEVAIEMGGGPAMMYGAKALEAFRDLKG